MGRHGRGKLDDVETPWGKVAELRARRLPPGPRPRGAKPTRRHQSERIYGALVALASDKGYARTSLRDLERVSGVTQASFYKYFRNKDECFLAAIEELYGTGIRAVEKGCADEADRGRRTRAALDGLIGLIEEQPAAARVCIVNVYEAGQPGARLAERALARFGELLARDLADHSGGAAMPDAIVAALVAGAQMVIHNHLQRGEAEKLPGLAPALADWLLSYAPPPALPAPPTPPRPPEAPASDLGTTEERLVRAVAEVCARDGARRLTAQAIVDQARISLHTLYERFPEGPAKAFLFAFEVIVGRCVAVSRAAYDATAGDWPARMDAVNRDLFAYLASEPDFARTVLVEVLGAGAEALARRDRTLGPFGDLLDGGRELAPGLPEVVREAIVFAVYSLVGREIAERGVAGVPGLVPLAGYIEFAPYLGAREAAGVVGRLAGEGAGGQNGSSAETSAASGDRPGVPGRRGSG